jgi:hypothetical protein
MDMVASGSGTPACSRRVPSTDDRRLDLVWEDPKVVMSA